MKANFAVFISVLIASPFVHVRSPVVVHSSQSLLP